MTNSLTFMGGAFLIISTTFISCKNNESTSTTTSTITTSTTPSLPTINEIVNSDTNFSLLKQAITRAGIGNSLSTGSLTVFAPDNSAFNAAGMNAASINALSVDKLTNILTYHVLARKVASTNMPVSDTMKTLQGNNLFASKNNNGIFVNGIKIKTADVQASNGVIHIISKVMIPPSKNIAALANSTASLSLLYAAVVKIGLATSLTSAGKYTIFAPTNIAFAQAGFPDVNAINNADTSVLAPIVRAHILKTNFFASDLISGALTPASLQYGVTLMIGLNPSSLKISTSNKPFSNINIPIGVDIIGTNGVIHLIDRVLL